MTIRHFDFSFFSFLTPGIFTTWGIKNEKNKKIIITTTKFMVLSVTLKMHDLKMTDKENYGSGKCRTGK